MTWGEMFGFFSGLIIGEIKVAISKARKAIKL